MRIPIIFIFGLLFFSNVNAQQQSDTLLAPAKLDNLWGYINTNGEFVIKPQFIDANVFNNGLAKVQVIRKDSNGLENKLWGFIDKTGKFVVEPKYYDAADFYEGFAAVYNEQFYYINKSGKIIFFEGSLNIPSRARNFGNFHNGKASVTIYELPFQYIIDTTGKLEKIDRSYTGEIVPLPYSYYYGTPLYDMSRFKFPNCENSAKQTLFPFSKKNDIHEFFGFVDSLDNIIIEPNCSFETQFNDGISLVVLAGKQLFISAKGEITIISNLEMISNFHNGFAAFIDPVSNKIGYINKNGKYIIKDQFFECGIFN